MRNRSRLVALALALASLAAACAPLPDLAPDTCGNFVKEAGEHCDGYALDRGTCAEPGAVNECHYVCEPGSSSKGCPIGWGCGKDGLCRDPSGEFERIGDIVPFNDSKSIRTADLDSDETLDFVIFGQEDAVGRRPVRLAYGPTEVAPSTVIQLPVEIAAASVGRLGAGAPMTDLVFGDLGGLSVLRGRQDRGTEFVPFPAAVLPENLHLRILPLDVLHASPGDELILFVDTKEGASLTRLEEEDGGQVTLAKLPGKELDLAGGRVIWGQLDEAAYCPQIVISFIGSSEVLVFSPCREEMGKEGWNENGSASPVTLPPGVFIDDNETVLADIDVDGHKDILIAANGRSYIAWGVGDGTFVSSKAGGIPGAAEEYALPAGMPRALAAGDINGDGAADFVGEGAVLVSGPDGYTVAYKHLGTSWKHAVIADFNDDDQLDIAAGSADVSSIEILNNAGKGILNPTAITTDGPTLHFAVGDFDGDLVTDLAFSEELFEEGDNSHAVAIAFGVAHSFPSVFVPIARLEEIEQLTTARFVDPTGLNSLSDLIVSKENVATKEDSAFVFQGTAARALRAPLPLRAMAAVSLPMATAIGNFGGGAPSVCVVAVGTGKTSEVTLWRVPAANDLTSRSLNPSAPLSVNFKPLEMGGAIGFRYGFVAAAGDLAHTSRSQVVAIGPYLQPGTAALVVAEFDDELNKFVARKERPFSAALTIDSEIDLLDVSGDGNLDVLLTTGTKDAPSELVVILNDGNGDFLTDQPRRIFLDRKGRGVSGFACEPRETGCDLLLTAPGGGLSLGGTYLLRWTAFEEFNAAARRLSDIPEGYALARGDFDHDGLLDIAIMTQNGLELYRARPMPF